jgi:ribosome-interacting GTPase 1
MPTNLPPEAVEAERRYRAAKSPEEKISTLEDFLRLIPKHKGTDKLRGDLRKKLSKLKSAAQGKKKLSKTSSAFLIDKEGAGQVVVIGHANVGKSALVAALTNADPQVAEFPFTTWQPTPGMMPIDDIQVQLVDTPPLNRDFLEPELFDLIKRSDMILLVVDLQADPFEQLEASVVLLEQRGIVPRHRPIENTDGRHLTGKPFLVLVNKNDDENTDEDYEIFCELLEADWPMLPISVAMGRFLDRMKRLVFEQLDIMRIYSKAPGEEPDLGEPFVIAKGSTVGEFAAKVHRDFFDQLKTARVWGSAAFDGQMVTRDHILCDGDVVELRI